MDDYYYYSGTGLVSWNTRVSMGFRKGWDKDFKNEAGGKWKGMGRVDS